MNNIYEVTDRQNPDALPRVKTVVTFEGDFAIETMNALFSQCPPENRRGLTFRIGTRTESGRIIWEDCSPEELSFIHGELGWTEEEDYDELFRQAQEEVLGDRQFDHPCGDHGHLDCASTPGGPCMDEAVARRYGQLVEKEVDRLAEKKELDDYQEKMEMKWNVQ